MNTENSVQQEEITQTLPKNNLATNAASMPAIVPSLQTTRTTMDFIPEMDRLTSVQMLNNEDVEEQDILVAPSLAETVLSQTALELKKKDISYTKKKFSQLTVKEIYNNTLKTIIAIIQDISELISEKEVMTNTEFRRKLVNSFFMKERRMYVGILFIIVSFILYFIDSSA